MKLILAVTHLRQSKMEVICEDRLGKRRRIEVKWLNKELTNSPPIFWTDIVESESDFCIDKENDEAQGRTLNLTPKK